MIIKPARAHFVFMSFKLNAISRIVLCLPAPQIFIDFCQKGSVPLFLFVMARDKFATGLWQFLQNGLVARMGKFQKKRGVGKCGKVGLIEPSIWPCPGAMFGLNILFANGYPFQTPNVACSIDRNWMKFLWVKGFVEVEQEILFQRYLRLKNIENRWISVGYGVAFFGLFACFIPVILTILQGICRRSTTMEGKCVYFAPFRCRVFEPSASCCVAKSSLLVNPSYLADGPVWLSGCLTPHYPHFFPKKSWRSVNLFGQDLQVVVDFFCSPFSVPRALPTKLQFKCSWQKHKSVSGNWLKLTLMCE